MSRNDPSMHQLPCYH